MKKAFQIILAIIAVTAITFAAVKQENESAFFQSGKIHKVKYEEIPQYITAKFENSPYGEWDVKRVFSIDQESEVYFELKVEKAGDVKDIIYDNEGKVTIVHH